MKLKPNPIIKGRRICLRCTRWRPITDFGHTASRKAATGVYISGFCQPCLRAQAREWYVRNREAHIARVGAWKKKNPDLVKRYAAIHSAKRRTPEGRAKENERQKKRFQDPVMGPRMREYFRIYRNMKRQEERGHGVTRRSATHGWREGSDLPMVPIEPFVEWFTSLNGSRPTDEQMGEALSRAVRRATSGKIKKIHLDTVDKVGVLVGEVGLIHLLYPLS
jgi:hypothetical protein